MFNNVKWIFVVLTICSLISFSFIGKNNSSVGLTTGDKAPKFTIECDGQTFSLDSCKSGYVLINFWASYDAESRINNVMLENAASKFENLQIVSISFDDYKSVYEETIKKDRLDGNNCYIDQDGESSKLYKSYRLGKGFNNYLLDENGIIIAKDINSSNLSSFIK